MVLGEKCQDRVDVDKGLGLVLVSIVSVKVRVSCSAEDGHKKGVRRVLEMIDLTFFLVYHVY